MKRPITLDIDQTLLGALDQAAAQVGESPAEFIVEAIRKRLSTANRERIDAAFAGMGDDAEDLQAMARIADELDSASDAAGQLLEPFGNDSFFRIGEDPGDSGTTDTSESHDAVLYPT